jgi:hypothetical protein
MYLIHYTSPTDPTAYEVRRYDLQTGTLAAKAVTDPKEDGAKMGGRPLARVESRDGRWAYTLYDGSGSQFVHALDTSTSTAHCIDLPKLAGAPPYWGTSLRLGRGGRTLAVLGGRTPRLAIDTRTFTTDAPAPPAGPRPTGGGFPWTLVVVLAGGLAAAATVIVARRRRPYSAGSKSSASELMQ